MWLATIEGRPLSVGQGIKHEKGKTLLSSQRDAIVGEPSIFGIGITNSQFATTDCKVK